MAKDPAFLFYSKDWIEGTADLMPNEKGVYIDLLCYQHQRGYLPIETERLARLVGLGHDEFLQIWKIVESKFNRSVNGMVNQRLSNEIEARKLKGHKNTVIGTFASLLRLGNFTKAQYLHLKKNFNSKDFENIEKEKITERLTEWLSLCLKSIENGNEDENEDKDIKKRNSIKIPKLEIPTLQEFLQIGKEKCAAAKLSYPEYQFSLTEKYQAWVDAGWKDGNGNKIMNWKSKLGNVIPHLKAIKQPQTSVYGR